MASLSCGAIFVKYLLCLFNFVFFAAGGLILAVSIWLAVDNTSFLLLTRLTDNHSLQVYNSPSVLEQGAYVMIAAGALIFLLGFLGCCGAAMESRSLLTTYGLLIIVLFVLQVTAGVLAAVYKTKAEGELEQLLKLSLHKHYSTDKRANAATLAWDAVMVKLECCGVNNHTDFDKAALWQVNKTNQQVVPRACCMDQRLTGRRSCINNPTPANSYYLTGCHGRIKHWIKSNSDILIFSVVGLGITELLAILLSFCLCSSVGEHRK